MGDCSDILRDGVRKTVNISQNQYLKMVLASKFTSMSQGQAQKYVEAGGSAIIEGIPIGGNYHEGQYEAWLNLVKRQLDVENIVINETNIVKSSGDENIINAWIGCMNRNGGLQLNFNPRDGQNILLQIKWHPYPLCTNYPKLAKDVLIIGADYVYSADKELLKAGTVFGNTDISVELYRNDVTVPVITNVWLVSWDQDIGDVRERDMYSDSAYLPPKQTLPEIPTHREIECYFSYPEKMQDTITLDVPFGDMVVFQHGPQHHGEDIAGCRVNEDGSFQPVMRVDGGWIPSESVLTKKVPQVSQFSKPYTLKHQGNILTCTPKDNLF